MPGRVSTPRMSHATSVDHGPNAAALEELRRRLATINSSGSCLNLAAAARESAGHQHHRSSSHPRTAMSAAAPLSTLAPPNPPPGHDRPSSPTDSLVSTTNSSTHRVAHRLQVGSADGQKAAPAVGSSNTNAVGVLEAPSRLRSEGSPERSGRSSPVSMAGIIKQSHRPRVTSLNPISTYGAPIIRSSRSLLTFEP
jgi:phosphoinositide-3-kinase regulatory subunit 4